MDALIALPHQGFKKNKEIKERKKEKNRNKAQCKRLMWVSLMFLCLIILCWCGPLDLWREQNPRQRWYLVFWVSSLNLTSAVISVWNRVRQNQFLVLAFLKVSPRWESPLHFSSFIMASPYHVMLLKHQTLNIYERVIIKCISYHTSTRVCFFFSPHSSTPPPLPTPTPTSLSTQIHSPTCPSFALCVVPKQKGKQYKQACSAGMCVHPQTAFNDNINSHSLEIMYLLSKLKNDIYQIQLLQIVCLQTTKRREKRRKKNLFIQFKFKLLC